MSPVVELMLRPLGKPLALNVTVSLDAAASVNCSETTSPWLLL